MYLVALQMNSQADWTQNAAQVESLLQRLPLERPCLVLLPENFACMGTPADYQQLAEEVGSGRVQQQLSLWAQTFGIWLVGQFDGTQTVEEIAQKYARSVKPAGGGPEDFEKVLNKARKRVAAAVEKAVQLGFVLPADQKR